jgi:hypothetical protein
MKQKMSLLEIDGRTIGKTLETSLRTIQNLMKTKMGT